ncbi:MAG: hypothetical protein ABI867_33435 [Kofleriaceae bacterium]
MISALFGPLLMSDLEADREAGAGGNERVEDQRRAPADHQARCERRGPRDPQAILAVLVRPAHASQRTDLELEPGSRWAGMVDVAEACIDEPPVVVRSAVCIRPEGTSDRVMWRQLQRGRTAEQQHVAAVIWRIDRDADRVGVRDAGEQHDERAA